MWEWWVEVISGMSGWRNEERRIMQPEAKLIGSLFYKCEIFFVARVHLPVGSRSP